MTAPQAPARPCSEAEFLQEVQKNPAEWWNYLTGLDAYRTWLEQQVTELKGVRNYQREELETAHDRIAGLHAQIQVRERSAPAVATPALAEDRPLTPVPVDTATVNPVNTRNYPLSERLPDPDKFNGDRNDLRRFTAQIYTKLTVNVDRFPTAESRMAYVNGRLEGTPYKQILPYIVQGRCTLSDYPAILDILDRAYGDPNRARNAQQSLFSLRQRNTEFGAFLAEFQRLALESNLSEESLPTLLENAVSKELRSMLLHNPPQSYQYHDLARHLQDLENRRRYYDSIVTPPHSRNLGTGHRQSPVQTISTPATRPIKQEITISPDAMDLSRHQRPSSRGRNRKERRECYRCGSGEHFVAQCPEPDNRTFRLVTARSVSRSVSPPISVKTVSRG